MKTKPTVWLTETVVLVWRLHSGKWISSICAYCLFTLLFNSCCSVCLLVGSHFQWMPHSSDWSLTDLEYAWLKACAVFVLFLNYIFAFLSICLLCSAQSNFLAWTLLLLFGFSFNGAHLVSMHMCPALIRFVYLNRWMWRVQRNRPKCREIDKERCLEIDVSEYLRIPRKQEILSNMC